MLQPDDAHDLMATLPASADSRAGPAELFDALGSFGALEDVVSADEFGVGPAPAAAPFLQVGNAPSAVWVAEQQQKQKQEQQQQQQPMPPHLPLAPRSDEHLHPLLLANAGLDEPLAQQPAAAAVAFVPTYAITDAAELPSGEALERGSDSPAEAAAHDDKVDRAAADVQRKKEKQRVLDRDRRKRIGEHVDELDREVQEAAHFTTPSVSSRTSTGRSKRVRLDQAEVLRQAVLLLRELKARNHLLETEKRVARAAYSVTSLAVLDSTLKAPRLAGSSIGLMVIMRDVETIADANAAMLSAFEMTRDQLLSMGMAHFIMLHSQSEDTVGTDSKTAATSNGNTKMSQPLDDECARDFQALVAGERAHLVKEATFISTSTRHFAAQLTVWTVRDAAGEINNFMVSMLWA
jgi:hypothetical protein